MLVENLCSVVGMIFCQLSELPSVVKLLCLNSPLCTCALNVLA